jgi:hypothetical protein
MRDDLEDLPGKFGATLNDYIGMQNKKSWRWLP